ncbi:energy transducer TonB [Vibrio aphrogenes]|uniref:energy transducer TonB n=1 Tax=Vibrio aphrogenes TaxID=1891186 RepID=UPI000B35C0D5|nr:energy transducer TonB [Vibrio aphrogenes]
MNVSRYTLAATVSIAVHAGIFSQFEVSNALAMPVGSQSTSIAVQFVQPASQPVINKKIENYSNKANTIAAEPSTSTPATKPNKPASKAELVRATSKDLVQKNTVVSKKISAPKKQVAANQPKAEKPEPPTFNDSFTPTKSPIKNSSERSKALTKSGVSEMPILIEQPNFLAPPTKPKYPRLAQKRGLEGTAMYEIWLDEDGSQIKQSLLSSSGAAMLDKAALDAIKKWKFSPRTVNGVSMAHRVQIPVRFKLD